MKEKRFKKQERLKKKKKETRAKKFEIYIVNEIWGSIFFFMINLLVQPEKKSILKTIIYPAKLPIKNKGKIKTW